MVIDYPYNISYTCTHARTYTHAHTHTHTHTHTLQGLGTDEDTLTRVMVSRSEIDLQQIKARFMGKYGKTLYSFIKVGAY